ncbi:MAG: hypothetical protein J6P87_09890 [Lachnospiraceae bacterium]|nr:hypothetical protein [Lachnospiraceae bacterium]
MIVKKGDFGYLKNRKLLMSAASIFLLAVIMIMYFGAKAHFGTNRNLFTIFAALCCIPAGKSIVSTIMYFLAKGCPDSARRVIDPVMEGSAAVSAYDLYLTGYSRNYVLWHTSAVNKSILVYSPLCAASASGGRKNAVSVEDHIKTILANDSITGWTVHVYGDDKKYTERLENILLSASHDAPLAGEKRVMEILKAVSL